MAGEATQVVEIWRSEALVLCNGHMGSLRQRSSQVEVKAVRQKSATNSWDWLATGFTALLLQPEYFGWPHSAFGRGETCVTHHDLQRLCRHTSIDQPLGETDEQLSFLKSLDCDEYQGFYFRRPIDASEVAGFVERAHQTRASGGGRAKFPILWGGRFLISKYCGGNAYPFGGW